MELELTRRLRPKRATSTPSRENPSTSTGLCKAETRVTHSVQRKIVDRDPALQKQQPKVFYFQSDAIIIIAKLGRWRQASKPRAARARW